MTRNDDTHMTDTDGTHGLIHAALVGSHGFERATVWGAVGFALAYVVYDVAEAVGVTGAWYAAGCVAVAAIGAMALARVGTGAVPCTLLVYGPAAAVLLRVTRPRYVDVLPFATVVEPLSVAVAVAVAVGIPGFLVGRLIAPSNAADDAHADADSNPDASGDSSSADPGDD